MPRSSCFLPWSADGWTNCTASPTAVLALLVAIVTTFRWSDLLEGRIADRAAQIWRLRPVENRQEWLRQSRARWSAGTRLLVLATLLSFGLGDVEGRHVRAYLDVHGRAVRDRPLSRPAPVRRAAGRAPEGACSGRNAAMGNSLRPDAPNLAPVRSPGAIRCLKVHSLLLRDRRSSGRRVCPQPIGFRDFSTSADSPAGRASMRRSWRGMRSEWCPSVLPIHASPPR